eukprot:scaffold228764_cov29-Tisochrysis_lutea.AAC.3
MSSVAPLDTPYGRTCAMRMLRQQWLSALGWARLIATIFSQTVAHLHLSCSHTTHASFTRDAVSSSRSS